MPDRCSCGAYPPEDARFCHKCGRPLFEMEPEPQPDPQPAIETPVVKAAAPAPEVAAARISFKNTTAVSMSIIAALGAFFLLLIVAFVAPAFAGLLPPVVLIGAGFFAPKLYLSRTHDRFTGAAGARLGWMTGLWFSVVVLVLVTFVSVIVAGPLGPELVEQMQKNPQFANIKLPSQHDFITFMMQAMVGTLFSAVLFAGLGGIIGARFWSKRDPLNGTRS